MSEKKAKTGFDFVLFKRVLSLTKPYKWLLFACLFLSVIMAPVTISRPYIVKEIVDNHITTGIVDGISFWIIIFIIFTLINVSLRYIFIYNTALLGQHVIKDLRNSVFDHIINRKLRFFDKTPIGTSTTRTINDVETINSLFSQGFITIIADVLTLIAVLGIMLYTSPILTFMVALVMPFLIYATYVFKEKVRAAYSKVRTQISKMNAFLQERITGMRVVQIFNVEQQEMEKFKTINKDYTQANLDSIFYYAVFFPVIELLSAIALALLVWKGTNGFLDDSVSFGTMVSFIMYLSMLFRPLRMLADKFNTLQMGLVAADRIYEVLDNEEEIENLGKIDNVDLDGNVSFDNVSFAYDGINKVIKDLSLDIDAGNTLAIVGSTGSGKTTIINILNRFYEIQEGDIKIDGKSIKDYDLQFLRSKMSMVLQDVFLFHGTVAENISLKDPAISREQIIEASKMIGAHPFILQLPDGYDYKVSERGQNMSLGQRQLISFVRALVFDPAILILDEATSSIDSETEAVIQHAIEKLIDKRTSIIIAHRLSTIRHADHILVMEQGRKVEHGSHDDLLKIEGGRYRELHDMQFLDAEVI